MNCPETFDPVCGMNGVNYGNDCRMRYHKVKLAKKGLCTMDNIQISAQNTFKCDSNHDHVCSWQGLTWENLCITKALQVQVTNTKSCKRFCDCDYEYKPVCAIDGRTYDNKCHLKCVGVLQIGRGECSVLRKNCNYCSDIEAWVCGQDGKNYKNQCALSCYQQKMKHLGMCT